MILQLSRPPLSEKLHSRIFGNLVPNWNGNFECPWFRVKKSAQIVKILYGLQDANLRKAIVELFGMSYILYLSTLIQFWCNVGFSISFRIVAVSHRFCARWPEFDSPTLCCQTTHSRSRAGAGRVIHIDLLALHKFYLGDTLIQHRYIFTWGY